MGVAKLHQGQKLAQGTHMRVQHNSWSHLLPCLLSAKDARFPVSGREAQSALNLEANVNEPKSDSFTKIRKLKKKEI